MNAIDAHSHRNPTTTRPWLTYAGWTTVGFAVGFLLLVVSAVILAPVVIWPSAVLGSAPFLALIVWLAWLVTQWVRRRLGGRQVALLVGTLLPVAYMAVETAVNHPQTIMFVGTHFS
jgi:hypothetical protein